MWFFENKQVEDAPLPFAAVTRPAFGEVAVVAAGDLESFIEKDFADVK